jgi:hypothetical protein
MHLRKFLPAVGVCLALLSTSCADNKPKPRTYPMGQRVTLGHLIYTVFETQWLTHLGEGTAQRVPQQRFFLVRMSITNSGPTELAAPALTLLADNGDVVSELTNGEGVPQWIGALRQIKPAETLQGNVLFDAQPRQYKMQVASENDEMQAMIEIPLSFTAETPEVPLPGSAQERK